MTKEIDDDFYVCNEFIFTDLIAETNDSNTDILLDNCTKQKYITKLNYSKYNFNVVKFRTGISNSWKSPELFDSLFDDLDCDNVINSKEIIEIDDMISNKNLLFFKIKKKNLLMSSFQ